MSILSLYVISQHKIYKTLLDRVVFPKEEGKKCPIQLTNSTRAGAWTCNQFLRGNKETRLMALVLL